MNLFKSYWSILLHIRTNVRYSLKVTWLCSKGKYITDVIVHILYKKKEKKSILIQIEVCFVLSFRLHVADWLHNFPSYPSSNSGKCMVTRYSCEYPYSFPISNSWTLVISDTALGFCHRNTRHPNICIR